MATTKQFTSNDSFVLPSGVSYIDVRLRSGSGYNYSGDPDSGRGRDISFRYTGVSGGETVYARIYSGGTGGGNGVNGQAGDAAGISINGTARGDHISVCGSGGGAGNESGNWNDGGDAPGPNQDGNDGLSGGVDGGDGGRTDGPGGGKTNGDDGSSFFGGAGGPNGFDFGGGGGGSGWYGGEGGGDSGSSAGGSGGGSGSTVVQQTDTTNITDNGDRYGATTAYVDITYPDPEPPAAPSSLSVTDNTVENQLSISWMDNSSSEDGFYIYRMDASGTTTTDYTQVDSVAPDTTTYTDTGLEDGERYYYRVTAYNSVGESDLSNEVNATTILPAPSAPTLDTTTEGEVSLSWSLNDDNANGRVEVRRNQDGTWRDGGDVVLDSLSISTTSYTDTGRLDGEQYHYRITRVTTDDDTISGPITTFTDSLSSSATTLLPPPSSLIVDSTQGDAYNLSWSGSANNGTYEVLLSSNGGTSFVTDANTASAPTTSATTTEYNSANTHLIKINLTTGHVSKETGTIESVLAGSVLRTVNGVVQQDANDVVMTDKP